MTEIFKLILTDEDVARRQKWDRRFLELAKHVAQWSKDPSTKVGAVIVDPRGIVVGMGYNGFARGVQDTPERYADRPTKYKFVVHAEVNAVLNATRDVRGATLYVWPTFNIPPVCHECAKVVVQAGIAVVASYAKTGDADMSRWKESTEASFAMLCEAGVQTRVVIPEAEADGNEAEQQRFLNSSAAGR